MPAPIAPPSGRLLVVVGCLAAAVGAGAAVWLWQAPARAIPKLGASTATVVPGVHHLGGLGPSSAYAIETPKGLVLVDSGLQTDAGPLKAELAKLGLDWKQIRAILLTHAHGDHTGGADHLRAATGAKIHAGRADAAVIRAGGPVEAIFGAYEMRDHRPHPTPVDVELAGGEILDFGGDRFQALAAPGHTPGSTCYLLERDGRRIFFGGDVVMRLDENSLGTYAAHQAPRYRGDARDYLATLKSLRDLAPPDLVLAGHRSSDADPRSPVFGADRWRSVMDAGLRELETLIARYEADGPDFLDGAPKELLPGLYYLGDRDGQAVYAIVGDAKLTLIDAPGGPGLAGFVDERLRRLGLQPIAATAVLLTDRGPDATAGLADLVERSHSTVVARRSALEAVRAACPAGATLLAAEDLAAQGWFEVEAIPLDGRGLDPVAYLVRQGDKAALFAGRMPILSNESSMATLGADLASPAGMADARQNAVDYMISVNKLARLRPDLWLPRRPSHGQNANLYDREWDTITTRNYRIGFTILTRFATPAGGA